MVDDMPPEALAELLPGGRWWWPYRPCCVRAADRQYASSALLVEALGIDLSTSAGAADVVVVSACLTAATTAFVRWAATGGGRPVGDLIDEAFAALRSI